MCAYALFDVINYCDYEIHLTMCESFCTTCLWMFPLRILCLMAARNTHSVHSSIVAYITLSIINHLGLPEKCTTSCFKINDSTVRIKD